MDPPSSPSEGQPAEPMMLTPRSKIRAMMAQIDDAPDIESGAEEASAPETDPGLSDSEEETSDVPMPRGRLAARLNPAAIGLEAAHMSNNASKSGVHTQLSDQKLQDQTETLHMVHPSSEPDPERESSPKLGMRPILFAKKTTQRSITPARSAVATPSSPSTRSPLLSQANIYPSQGSPNVVPSEPSDNPQEGSGSDTNTPFKVQRNERFLALVAKKKAAREAREAIEEEKRRQKLREYQQRLQQSSDRLDEIEREDMGADGEDAAANKALSSQVKPTRKASKKALEEMNRVTQRLNRNQQLAHAATTRKKYTVNDLFQKFNYSGSNEKDMERAAERPRSSSRVGSSELDSDAEARNLTPPTSPMTPDKSSQHVQQAAEIRPLPTYITDEQHLESDRADEELPTVDDFLAASTPIRGKDKSKEVDAPETSVALAVNSALAAQTELHNLSAVGGKINAVQAKASNLASTRHFRVKSPAQSFDRDAVTFSESDSDLEVEPRNLLHEKLRKVRDRAPAKNKSDDAMHRLRALAHLTSPSKRDKRYSKSSVPAGRMLVDLQMQARRQAAVHRAERLDELRSKGVIIQTAEEREREQMDTENLLEKARQEEEELTRREREERKKAHPDGKNQGSLELDDSDDESYQGSNDEDEAHETDDANDADMELSGSEDEADADESERDPTKLIDDEASDSGGDEGSKDGKSDTGVEAVQTIADRPDADQARPRRGRIMRVLDDEEDETIPEVRATDTAVPISPIVVNPFTRSVKTNPLEAIPMGLSQAFVSTMDDSQTEAGSAFSSAAPFMMPEPDFPVVDQRAIAQDDPFKLSVLDTQSSPSYPARTLTQNNGIHENTQLSEIPDATQDAGIVSTSPFAKRFSSIPPSTVATVLLSGSPNKVDQMPRKRGRLVRGLAADFDDGDGDGKPRSDAFVTLQEADGATFDSSSDAFAAMKKGESRRARQEAFDKKRSNAKDMIQEQAEESEDEYAGLGGASDDDSGSEIDEETKKMMDDGQVELNESQLAAFHADKERVADEKAVEKLYKDINTGNLRRKRGAAGGFDDLSDSDEEIERRRRIRRAENARMRKALLNDENVGKIAENPKKAAFLKAIEDREDDSEPGFLDEYEALLSLAREESIQEVPNSQPAPEEQSTGADSRGEKRKRPLEEADPNARPPPAERRTKATVDRKPSSLAEIRESLSFLTGEPHRQAEVQVAATQSSDAEEDRQNSRFASRRRFNSIVDRLSLKRAESADVAASKCQERSAFHRARKETDSGFSVPNLKKFHTVEGAASEVSYATERTAGASGRANGDQVRRGGTKKSSVAFYARDAEKRVAVDRIEKRRDLERKRLTEGRRGALKGLGGTFFE